MEPFWKIYLLSYEDNWAAKCRVRLAEREQEDIFRLLSLLNQWIQHFKILPFRAVASCSGCFFFLFMLR